MTTKHTPGPWVKGYKHCPNGVYTVDGELIANTHSATRGFRRDEQIAEQDANARLIAAAPDMYDALPDLSHVITWLRNGCDPIKAANELQAYQRRIDCAIAKAEGRE